MTVYLGEYGAVQIKRESGFPINGTLVPSDVSVEKRRFSLNDYDVQGELIAGDQVDITRLDGGNLQLVDGHNYPDWRGYVFVDQLGGLRLYEDFADALVGDVKRAFQLVEPSENQSLRIATRGARFNYLGEVRSYEITTERETVDVTHLGNQFRQQYEAGLISGQGRLDCFFEFKYNQQCDEESDCGPGTEYAMYLAQLCIRLTQGADFFGRFFVYHPTGCESSCAGGVSEIEDIRGNTQAVWYETDCVVTNCVVSVEPTQAITATINFVTTGRIKLLTGVPPAFLLQEDSSLILQEDGVSRLFLAGQDV